MANFIEQYRALCERLLRPLRDSDGVDESLIVAGEARLGLRLPKVLREFYLLAGALDRINHAHEQLLPPDCPQLRLGRGRASYNELSIENGGLALYVENQGGWMWGIETSHLGEPDPPVALAENIEDPAWKPFHDRLSGFLIGMFYHQASMAGASYGGRVKADASLVARVEEDWPLACEFGNAEERSSHFHSRGGVVITFRKIRSDIWLCVAARTANDREDARRGLKLEWEFLWPEHYPFSRPPEE